MPKIYSEPAKDTMRYEEYMLNSLIKMKTLIFLFIFTTLALPAQSEAVKYVSTSLIDGELKDNFQLGNQLFMIAAASAYAWDNQFTPIFPHLNEPGANRLYNRDHIFFRLDTQKRDISNVYYDLSWEYTPIPIFSTDISIAGLFQSWKYFHHRRQEILNLFAPSQEVLDYLSEKYADLIAAPNTVGIHVRTADAKIHQVIPFPGLTYYGLAIDCFPPDSLFVVFSDRINWCKKHFKKKFPGRKFIFSEGNDHIQDLFLLSLMKHHIISNSTYSWWAAYMSSNPDQVVVGPQERFNPIFRIPTNDFYLPEWIRIHNDMYADTYPEDMYWYDEKSQSLDNNPKEPKAVR